MLAFAQRVDPKNGRNVAFSSLGQTMGQSVKATVAGRIRIIYKKRRSGLTAKPLVQQFRPHDQHRPSHSCLPIAAGTERCSLNRQPLRNPAYATAPKINELCNAYFYKIESRRIHKHNPALQVGAHMLSSLVRLDCTGSL